MKKPSVISRRDQASQGTIAFPWGNAIVPYANVGGSVDRFKSGPVQHVVRVTPLGGSAIVVAVSPRS
jgi:hypothetical protein